MRHSPDLHSISSLSPAYFRGRRLRDQPGACQNEVARLHQTKPITISRQLDKLELFGLVERRHDVKDRRIWTAARPAKGRRTRDACRESFRGTLLGIGCASRFDA